MPGRYYGKYTGLVRDNRDPDKLGQLQVSVPAIFPANELLTARPALPYGHFFVPEVEAKVWVEFEGGDPGLPLWTGVQYVAGEWAAEAEADPPRKRVIKTAAGHLLIFNDAEGEAAVEIQDGANGHVITLTQDGITLTDGVNQHEITLTGQGINIQDSQQHAVTLEAAGITVKTATAKVEIKDGMVTVDAGAGVAIVTGSTVKLGPGAIPVLRLGDQGVGNLGAPVPITITTNAQVLA